MNALVAPLALLWPAAVLLALTSERRRLTGAAAVVVLTAGCVLLALLTLRVAGGEAVEVVAGGWPADVGIRLRADALGAVFALVSCAVLLAALVQGLATDDSPRLLPALTLFLGVGLTGLFLTADVFSFYVFFELAMISSYALAGAGGEARMVGGAFIFAVVNLLGSFLFLIAVAALYHVTGTLEMAAVADRMSRVEPNTAVLISVTFFVAFGVKLGLFPFHFWLPSIYASAPPAVAAMLAGALANIGGYGLLRFGAGLLPGVVEFAGGALIAIGSLSIVYGALQAIARRNAREVLAYSAIGHAGYILVALGLGGPVALTAAVVFTLVNAINKALLFLVVDLRGPLMGAVFAVAAFSVAGVPPVAGFFGKATLFEAGVDAGSVTAVALLFLGGALTFVYLFQVYQHVHWAPKGAVRIPDPGRRRAIVVALAAGVLALGLWPEPLLAISEQAAEDLLGRQAP